MPRARFSARRFRFSRSSISILPNAEIGAALADPVETEPLALENWLQSLARVRPPMADLALAVTAAQWATGEEPRLVPVQLPRHAGDPWIGAGWAGVLAAGDVMSVMTIDPPAMLTGGYEGFILDEWTETVADADRGDRLCFQFRSPERCRAAACLPRPPIPTDAGGGPNWSAP